MQGHITGFVQGPISCHPLSQNMEKIQEKGKATSSKIILMN